MKQMKLMKKVEYFKSPTKDDLEKVEDLKNQISEDGFVLTSAQLVHEADAYVLVLTYEKMYCLEEL